MPLGAVLLLVVGADDGDVMLRDIGTALVVGADDGDVILLDDGANGTVYDGTAVG